MVLTQQNNFNKINDQYIEAIREWINGLPQEPQPTIPPIEATEAYLQEYVFDISCAYSGCHDDNAILPLTALHQHESIVYRQ